MGDDGRPGPHGLVDTGPLIAILDRDDRWHARCTEALKSLRLPLLTSEAIVTELFHMVGDTPREVDAAWALLRSGAFKIAPISDSDLRSLHALIRQYHDRPMDFADATLVHLAERESLSLIFTVDHDDFETYRVHGRRRFRIVPERE